VVANNSLRSTAGIQRRAGQIQQGGTNQIPRIGRVLFYEQYLGGTLYFLITAVLPGARKHLFDFAGGGFIIQTERFLCQLRGLRQGSARATQAVIGNVSVSKFGDAKDEQHRDYLLQ